MRITKKYLEAEIKEFRAYQRCDLVVVGISDQQFVRNLPGFIPVCRYGLTGVALKNELGLQKNTRFLTKPLPKWKRPRVAAPLTKG